MPMAGTLPLRTGADGEAVADLQRRLTAAGHPTEGDPPAEFGTATEAAVRDFQVQRGLRSDGICGEETWASLVDAGHQLGDRLLYERVPVLRGDDIAELQRLLGELGFDAGRVDGFFGPATTAALLEFQRNVGLPTDGVCGPDTVEALRRVVGRTGEGSTVARLREADALRRRPLGLGGRRIVVGEGGEATGLADALGRALRTSGAVVSVVHHPDAHERAGAANAFDAMAFVGLVVRSEPGLDVAFYAREGFESVGGHRLAEMVQDSLPDDLSSNGPPTPKGMRLPELVQTRMPAVLVEVGPPTLVVEHAPRLVEALTAAVTRWATEPLD
jgi:N-acetylmuramoyl-L-alanine amidase